jgi:hypothetical protein
MYRDNEDVSGETATQRRGRPQERMQPTEPFHGEAYGRSDVREAGTIRMASSRARHRPPRQMVDARASDAGSMPMVPPQSAHGDTKNPCYFATRSTASRTYFGIPLPKCNLTRRPGTCDRARFRFAARRCSRHCVCSNTRCDDRVIGIRPQNRGAAAQRSRDFVRCFLRRCP